MLLSIQKHFLCVPVNTAKNVILIVPLILLTNREIKVVQKNVTRRYQHFHVQKEHLVHQIFDIIIHT